MSLFLLVLSMVLFVVSLVVQFWLKKVYGNNMEIANGAGLTGEQVARRMLDSAGLNHVPVKMTAGHLTDHYNPITDEVFLSESNFKYPSIAGAAVAAHEVGHAMQKAENMSALILRGKMAVPLQFGSNFAPYLILAGIFFKISGLIWLGVIFFGFTMLFHLVTLPVEFDASARALKYLRGSGIIAAGQEDQRASKVLQAAAMTYVMAFLISLVEFVRLLTIARDQD